MWSGSVSVPIQYWIKPMHSVKASLWIHSKLSSFCFWFLAESLNNGFGLNYDNNHLTSPMISILCMCSMFQPWSRFMREREKSKLAKNNWKTNRVYGFIHRILKIQIAKITSASTITLFVYGRTLKLLDKTYKTVVVAFWLQLLIALLTVMHTYHRSRLL